MAKKKTVSGSPNSNVGEADGVQVGEEPVPGMRLRCICRGHTDIIGRIAWSPCGRYIASPSFDETIRIWDANDSLCLAVLECGDAVSCIAWSPDGTKLSSGGHNGTLSIWDVERLSLAPSNANGTATVSFKAARLLHVGEGHNKMVRAVSWSPDGKRIVTTSEDGTVRIWSAENSNQVQILTGHAGVVNGAAWSRDGKYVASTSSDKTAKIWDVETGKNILTLFGHSSWVFCTEWSPDQNVILTGADDHTIRVWDPSTGAVLRILEGHTDIVNTISFAADGRLLASASSYDGTLRIWRTEDWSEVVCWREMASRRVIAGTVAFHPLTTSLAALGEYDTVIRIWEVNATALLGFRPSKESLGYTSAKIVLIGESNVGKSCLAMRLVENRYPDDHEHGTTHGMRFWPMEAEELHPAAKPPEGQRRDVVLWDFGGQDEYQLVHQMFLHDTTLALVLIDPTRGQKALNEARDWNKRLEKHLGPRKAVKLLVGAQVDGDSKSGLINRGAVEALCKECGFAGFYETSALNGRGIDGFRDALADALDWENLAKTNRPELFQRIRDEIESLRRTGEIVVSLDELISRIADFGEELEHSPSDKFVDYGNEKSRAYVRLRDSVDAVADQLALQGIIVRTVLSGGDDALVLQLPVIERYAASLIVAARNNPRGVPALESSELGSPNILLPGMTDADRVPRSQERPVLEAVTELMIDHGLCFRHEGLLVFPTLLKATETARADELPGSVSLYYDFSGAIDNVYASLISWLVIGQEFGRIRLWENRVEFEAESRGACGLRKVNRGGGFAHLDVYFHDGTSTQTQTDFISFVHQHLRSSGIDVVEHFELICGNTNCRYEFPREVVQNRMAKGETDVVCPQCESRIKLSEGFRQQTERDEGADRKSFALMTRVLEDVPKIVASVKEQAFGRADEEYQTDRPIRILHLSDLHFTADTVPETKLQWLVDDIRKGKWAGGGELDYVVISGDMTHQGSGLGFRRASEFVSFLVERFGLSAERFVFVPGNHDVQDLDGVYDWRLNVSEEEKKRAVKEGRLFGLPNDRYDERLKEFSDQFYHPLLQKPYPLDPARQGVAYIFPEAKLQFLTLNSCWEIDQFHRTRASVHPDAVARLIAEADRQIERAIVNTSVKPKDYLRIGVWHHPVTHPKRAIGNPEFLDHLMNRAVRVCLTGDIHELSRDVVRHWHANRMYVVGAGSFGAKEGDLSEGSPRLYNLLEIDREFRSIRVHTRQQPKPNGAWKGWNEWPRPDGGDGGLPYFDIPLK